MVLHNKIAYITDIIGKRGQQQRILSELPEHGAELAQILPEKFISLLPCHCMGRILFPGLQAMTPTYIGVMPGRMPALKPLDALDGKAEPVLFLLYRIFRPQRNTPEAGNGEKRRKQLCSYSHRQVRFIVIR